MNETLSQPTKNSATIASHKLGAAAVTAMVMPNPVAVTISVRRPVVPRAATMRPPTTAPTPIDDVMNPKACGPPSKTSRAATGSDTWNSYASVPTSAIMTSGTHRMGLLRT
ncbi:Uncharacterised protein [Mycobacteroides abscessus subsp. abscessus]|nr:Uncharacterised protein [Mycobacteroides abscessus subsp. abscessus]